MKRSTLRQSQTHVYVTVPLWFCSTWQQDYVRIRYVSWKHYRADWRKPTAAAESVGNRFEIKYVFRGFNCYQRRLSITREASYLYPALEDIIHSLSHESRERRPSPLFLHIILNVGAPAFVSAQSSALDDSFSLNNIKRRCEMISDSACCLSLRRVSPAQPASDYQDLVVLSGECNKEGRWELREGERGREREREQWKAIVLGGATTAVHGTSVEMTLWGTAVDFWS